MNNKINTLVAKVFDVSIDVVNENSGPENIDKWDSLGQLALVSAIEQDFKITLEIEEIFQIMKVGDIYKILQNKGFN